MNVLQVLEAIHAFMETNSYSQTRLAKETGIPQSTIARALKAPVRVTRTHRALCKFARISLDSGPGEGGARETLVQTVLDVWDGTREHAQSIARLLKAGATLEAYGASRATKPRKTNAAP